MKKVNQGDIGSVPVDGASGVEFRELLGRNVAAPNFHMRLFEISPGGSTPRHMHAWEHEVYVLQGSGKLLLRDREEPLRAGDAVYVEQDELHQFVNTDDSPLRLICVIPKPGGD